MIIKLPKADFLNATLLVYGKHGMVNSLETLSVYPPSFFLLQPLTVCFKILLFHFRMIYLGQCGFGFILLQFHLVLFIVSIQFSVSSHLVFHRKSNH